MTFSGPRMSSYSRRNNYSDSDDDRYKLSSTASARGGYSNSYSTSNYNDRADSRYTSYRNPRAVERSDSDDNTTTASRYGASTRRNVRYSSDSDTENKFDRNRRGGVSSRPMTSARRDYDSDSYDGANVKQNYAILRLIPERSLAHFS